MYYPELIDHPCIPFASPLTSKWLAGFWPRTMTGWLPTPDLTAWLEAYSPGWQARAMRAWWMLSGSRWCTQTCRMNIVLSEMSRDLSGSSAEWQRNPEQVTHILTLGARPNFITFHPYSFDPTTMNTLSEVTDFLVVASIASICLIRLGYTLLIKEEQVHYYIVIVVIVFCKE